MRVALFCLLLTLVISVNAQNSPITFQSSEEATALIELYSSEGCNSCPPAESWLNGLKGSDGLWKRFVPMDFHVDYWDYLGWRDPWGSGKFSARQREYAAKWKSESVYTPEFVVNGKEWRDWTPRSDAPVLDKKRVGVLTATSTNINHWSVAFVPVNSAGGFEAHVAVLGNGLESDVKRGENSGRRLKHEFTVLQVVNARLVKQGDSFVGEISLPERNKFNAPSLALAVWMTRAGELEPLQATGGWWQ